MDASGLLGWVAGAVVTVVATLAGVVATLWKLNESKNSMAIEHLKAKAEACEKDRAELRERVIRLEVKQNADASQGEVQT